MTDMSKVIVPKSDQINADDLIAGPITITIESVDIRPGTEQPVTIHYTGGKPWRPCKSMSRVLVAAWGPDAKVYAGRSARLYRDPTVKWGGLEVGGIRISHLSHIDKDMVIALTATRGSRKPFTVKKLEPVNARPDPAKLVKAFGSLGVTEQMLSEKLGHSLDQVNDAEFCDLRRVYKSLSDRSSNVEDHFRLTPFDSSESDNFGDALDIEGADAQPVEEGV